MVGARAGSLREGAARPSGTWAKGKKAPQKAGLGPCGGCRACLEKGLEGGPCPATRARGSVQGRGCGGGRPRSGAGGPPERRLGGAGRALVKRSLYVYI